MLNVVALWLVWMDIQRINGDTLLVEIAKIVPGSLIEHQSLNVVPQFNSFSSCQQLLDLLEMLQNGPQICFSRQGLPVFWTKLTLQTVHHCWSNLSDRVWHVGKRCSCGGQLGAIRLLARGNFNLDPWKTRYSVSVWLSTYTLGISVATWHKI